MPNKKITQLTEFTEVAADDLFAMVDDPSGTPETKKITVENLTLSGWIPAGETWTYASANDPEFTFTISGDKTSKYSAGMKVKLNQTSDKFFIITKVSYGAPNTTVTIYGGTDYDLANAAIASPFYSRERTPFGFPLEPTKWTVELNDTANNTQINPVNTTWYNLGTLSIDIPTGVWRVSLQVTLQGSHSGGTTIEVEVTLSTANNSESDADLTAGGMSSAATTTFRTTINRWKVLSIGAAVTYYLNTRSMQSSITNIYNAGAVIPTIVRAECAYL